MKNDRDLSQMNSSELKRYLSENRNNEVFSEALEVLIDRFQSNELQPYPFDTDDPESQAKVTLLLKEKLDRLGDI
jgi:hypothetical protein